MDVKSMLSREDFYRIFKETYEDYINNCTDNLISVTYFKNRFKGEYVCYEKLNVITRKIPDKEHICYALSEYNIRGSIFKYIIAKVWVLLNFASLGLAGGMTFSIEGAGKKSNNMIWPCNRSIRIFDFDAGTVTSIVKKWFPLTFFENSIKFRLNNSYGFIPPLLEHGKNWFKEPVLPGKALARVCDAKIYSESVKNVLDSMRIIAEKTVKRVDVLDYAKQLELEIDKKIKTAIENKGIETADLIKETVKNSMRWVGKSSGQIPVALTHGDLQTGNIWFDDMDNKVYIIDWETNAYRSIWYDPATLFCSLRRKNGLNNMIKKRNEPRIKECLLVNDEFKQYEMDMVIGIIILENIMFYLDDLLSLPDYYGGEDFDNAILETIGIDWDN